MPEWAVAIVVGLASGLLGTLLTIGHERGAEFRTRMLEAADGFLNVAAACYELMTDVRKSFEGDERGDESGRKLDELRDARRNLLTINMPRIRLLFGGEGESEAWERATDAHTALESFEAVYRSSRTATGLRLADGALESAVTRWSDAIGDFPRAARNDVRRSAIGTRLRRIG
jgi:hypothetical protein